MSNIYRRTLIELIARYELEPNIKDFFVEGALDKDIFSAAVSGDMESYFSFYEIDSIELPADLLTCYNLTTGNKQRVIALARELDKSLPNDAAVLCLVDPDLDHWIGNEENCRFLKVLSFCSIELHFLSPDLVKSLLGHSCRTRINEWNVFYESLVSCLKQLYAIRLAHHELNLRIKFMGFTKYLQIQGQVLSFDFVNYSNRWLTANGLSKQHDCFFETTAKWQGILEGDPRRYIRGHDFVECLSWSARKFAGIKEMADDICIERLMVTISAYSEDVRKSLISELSCV